MLHPTLLVVMPLSVIKAIAKSAHLSDTLKIQWCVTNLQKILSLEYHGYPLLAEMRDLPISLRAKIFIAHMLT